MSAKDSGLPLVTGTVQPPAAERPTHPFYWSVRRELWESRAVTLAPLGVAAITVVATLISFVGLPQKLETYATLSPAEGHRLLVQPFSVAPAPIMLAALLVGFFYALDALYGERRDRSVLFWKSLPVSDRTTVLAKASIPVLVLPGFALLLSWAAFFVLLGAATLILWASGAGAGPLLAEVHFVEEPLVMAYGLTAHTLWFAPLYAWALLISAWARRLPVLWMVLPPVILSLLERYSLGSSHLLSLFCYRIRGAMQEAFVAAPEGAATGGFERLAQLDPGRFFRSPGLWLGLVVAAACLLAAARLRRHGETL